MENNVITEKKILIGTIIKNCGPYLRNLAVEIAKVNFPKENISLAFLENDSEDDSWKILNTKVIPFLSSFTYRKISVAKEDYGYRLKHSSRHRPEAKDQRNNCITRARQHIVNNYLQDNDYIWWVDADLKRIPQDTLRILLMYQRDCISPVYRTDDGKLYDASSHRRGKSLKDLLTQKEVGDLMELDGTNCQALMHRRVFDTEAQFHVEGEENSNYIQSQRMKKTGIKFYIATKMTVIHHTICGTKPL